MELYSYLCRARTAFSAGMQHGVRVDRAALSAARDSAEERVAQLASEFGFNPESQPQTLAAMREAGYKVDSVAEDVLRDLEGDLPSKLLAFREQNKLLKGFLRPLQEFTKESEYVYPTYKLHGTDSGRTSCADPNLQQVPPELQHLFIASPGKVLLGWDYRAHEVRGIALLSRDEQLCELLRAPSADPHQWVAEHIGMGRQEGKHTLFAVAYGAGEAKLIKALGIKPGEARRAVETVRHLFPGLTTWREEVIQQMYEQGYVETPYYHRRRHFDYVDEHTAPHQERVAVNFLPQSLCGDVAMDSAVSVWEELGLAPLVFVHDFNAVEVLEGRAEEYKERCQEIASAICPNEYVKFLPEMHVGHSWKEMKP